MKLTVNGTEHAIDPPPDMPLLWVLRDQLGITGPKFGCGAGLCGACSVEVNGSVTRSCVLPATAVAGAKIRTIEAMDTDPVGNVVQATWRELEVAQCGYCQSGQIMAATELLRNQPAPTDKEIKDAMSNTLCRCATYPRILAAIKQAATALKKV
jgi:isoquinoline 1-oxidoreductase alpha subunit